MIAVPDGLGVRISGFHPDGPGSIPGLGAPFFIPIFTAPYCRRCQTRLRFGLRILFLCDAWNVSLYNTILDLVDRNRLQPLTKVLATT